MKELHDQILSSPFEFKEEISEDAKSLIMGLLERNVNKRLTVDEALKHPFLAKTEKQMDLFNEGEKYKIFKEFTINRAGTGPI